MDQKLRKIIQATIVSFDLFNHDEIERVNKEISGLFGRHAEKGEVAHSPPGFPSKDYKTSVYTWKISSDHAKLGLLQSQIRTDGNLVNLSDFIEEFSIQGFESLRIPDYVVVSKFKLKPARLNMDADPQDRIMTLLQMLRFLVQELKGFSNSLVPWQPSTSGIVDIKCIVPAEEITNLNMKTLELKAQQSSDPDRAFELSRELRSMKPFPIGDRIADFESHIPAAQNVHHILGLMSQPGIVGLRAAYIMILSTEDLFTAFEVPDSLVLGAVPITSNLFLQGYHSLLTLMALDVWAEKVIIDAEDLDRKLVAIRHSVPEIRLDSKIQIMIDSVKRASSMSAQLSSKLAGLGGLVRLWKDPLSKLLVNFPSSAEEVLLMPRSKGIDEITYFDQIREAGVYGGLMRMLTSTVLLRLESAQETLERQEAEVARLHRHIYDLIMLRQTNSIEKLTRAIKWLTAVVVGFAATTLILQILEVLPLFGR